MTWCGLQSWFPRWPWLLFCGRQKNETAINSPIYHPHNKPYGLLRECDKDPFRFVWGLPKDILNHQLSTGSPLWCDLRVQRLELNHTCWLYPAWWLSTLLSLSLFLSLVFLGWDTLVGIRSCSSQGIMGCCLASLSGVLDFSWVGDLSLTTPPVLPTPHLSCVSLKLTSGGLCFSSV